MIDEDRKRFLIQQLMDHGPSFGGPHSVMKFGPESVVRYVMEAYVLNDDNGGSRHLPAEQVRDEWDWLAGYLLDNMEILDHPPLNDEGEETRQAATSAHAKDCADRALALFKAGDLPGALVFLDLSLTLKDDYRLSTVRRNLAEQIEANVA